MHFPDKYKYPIFFVGMLIMIVAAFAYKFNIISFYAEEIIIVVGAVLFVFSIASAALK
ncbi:MAG: hypothetical protein QXL94_07895 [Candidatus Parvarchaeum sp.]